jgi:hypothetical protein
MHVSASADAEPQPARAADPRLQLGAAIAGALLFGLAYRSFLLPEDHLGIEKGIEYWFFRPNQTGAIVVLLLASWLLYRRWPRLAALPATRASWWLIGPAFGLGIGVFLWAGVTWGNFFLHPLSNQYEK